jgi:hypothetical protein
VQYTGYSPVLSQYINLSGAFLLSSCPPGMLFARESQKPVTPIKGTKTTSGTVFQYGFLPG